MMTALAVVTLILGLFVISHEVSPILAGCGSIFLPDQHHALVGHSFLAQTGTGRIQCMMLCWRHSRCLSFNHDDTSGTCQLNHARKEEFPESYKQDGRLSYFSSSQNIEGFKTTADKTATTLSAGTAFSTAVTTDKTAATASTMSSTTSTTADTSPSIGETPIAVITTSKLCSSPFGMESGAIADFQITSSNALNDDYTNYGPTLARFNGNKSWCGKKIGSPTWIQVELDRTVDLCCMIVQGRSGSREGVSQFSLSYSDDGVSWTSVTDENGATKRHSSSDSSYKDVRVLVESAPSLGMIRCEYIRIKPVRWYYEKCMRFELFGCD